MNERGYELKAEDSNNEMGKGLAEGFKEPLRVNELDKSIQSGTDVMGSEFSSRLWQVAEGIVHENLNQIENNEQLQNDTLLNNFDYEGYMTNEKYFTKMKVCPTITQG